MKDASRIESHKMMFHPEWVARWKEAMNDWEVAKKLYPLYIEATPTAACNHNCLFCAVDYIDKNPLFIDADIFKKALADMAAGGVKSIMYAGEGEPTLHPKLDEIVLQTKNSGIDVAFTTNGSNLNERFLDKCLDKITWIKVSIDAGTKETHLRIHRPKNENDWENIFNNLETAVNLKKEKRNQCWLGAQSLLLPRGWDKDGSEIPSNEEEIAVLAEKLKSIGVDCLVVKPYSHQPLSETEIYKDISYGDYSKLSQDLEKIADDNFEIVFRSHTMEKYSQDRSYHFCGAVPFAWAYIMGDGSVYSCSVYLLDEKFYLGNINEQSFKEIWEGERRKRHWEFMREFNPKNCRKNCRMDEVNKYLWGVSNAPYNVNFI